MADFHIGDTVQVADQEFPIVFVVTNITKGPTGPMYAGDGQGWWPEEKLDYFLTEEQLGLRQKYERVVDAADKGLKELQLAATALAKSPAMPEWFKTWFFKECGRLLGWDHDLK